LQVMDRYTAMQLPINEMNPPMVKPFMFFIIFAKENPFYKCVKNRKKNGNYLFFFYQ